MAETRAYFANAGVSPLPRAAADALAEFGRLGSRDCQENDRAWAVDRRARELTARLIGAAPEEISLIGPTSLGLNIVAQGLDWRPGDEVVYYGEDYPANVYPWAALSPRGVRPVALAPDQPGVITWDVVEAALTARTRLVALASCHFMSGYRIDVDDIGRRLGERGVLFCLDGIQTLGAFPLSVKHVDFMSADSHKWMLGPIGAGVFFVKRERQDALPPPLLGSWNVQSPDYVAQDVLRYHTGGRRYETGALNLPGIFGMAASLELLKGFGIDAIAARLLDLRRYLLERVRPLGFRLYLEEWDLSPAASDAHRTAIISLRHPKHDMDAVYERLLAERIVVSLRRNRRGEAYLRFSPHCYNKEEELDRAVAVLARG
ncbi:MAG TPA: aminotransferase class V-fold PLP-dependent enzyme [Candidatus Hydrogenedentes bacterium]|nr:aminotransferase class V-fold PLP-dependent enzyme [Candidatus Hydrogenedentota bacterium]HNT88719.1 aminotransferase class V-fold PLP-dependent enzyme [Candidatus Hydrogenedentota bacterium]